MNPRKISAVPILHAIPPADKRQVHAVYINPDLRK